LRLVVLTGWAPAVGQPRPARPGSATVRLAGALGTVEHGTGEKPGP
ncbi:SAM-dependent methyltransferase, partial [Roseomonas alkaliterrae]|nr:SAM-dependent methyltransferase [Neoroseomonas alkaliterrae]